ncbi:hypothetical protein [Streptomyces sp. NPDC006527]|uniref:hypothetical protein n=1 Tax=Streptomyces sp. NPDC006527 TaxID=3364749 RepID=UPI003697D891
MREFAGEAAGVGDEVAVDQHLLSGLVLFRNVLYWDGHVGGRRRTLIARCTVNDPHGREAIGRLVAADMALEIALSSPCGAGGCRPKRSVRG